MTEQGTKRNKGNANRKRPGIENKEEEGNGIFIRKTSEKSIK